MAVSHLGFYDLMNIAEQNIEETARKSKGQQFVSYTPTSAKKLDPKQKKLSENVQKFLAKKEQEKKVQLEDAKRKRERLVELRSHDKKATKRVGQMLRMTKSANKAVISDAMNCLNDSLAEQGEYQPDEDDYGYVSQYAEEFHKKMMEKYKAIPASKPVRRNANIPLPVPEVQSLKSSKTPLDTTSTHSSSINSYVPDVRENNQISKKAKDIKRPKPPLLNFTDLLEIAKEKCKEPVVIKKQKIEHDEEKYEFGRPMTAKEKADYLKERAIRERISVPNFDTRSFSSSRDKNNNKEAKVANAKTPTSFKIPSKPVKNTAPPILQTNTRSKSPLPTPPSAPLQSNSQMLPPQQSRTPSVVSRSSVPSNRATSLPSNVANPSTPLATNSQRSKPTISSSPASNSSLVSSVSNTRASSTPSTCSLMPPPRSIPAKDPKKFPPVKGANSDLASAFLSTKKFAPPPSRRAETREDEQVVKYKSEKIDVEKRPSQIFAPAKVKSEFDRNPSYSVKQPAQSDQISVKQSTQPNKNSIQSQGRNRIDSDFRSRPQERNINSMTNGNKLQSKRDAQPSKPKPTGRQIIESDDEAEEDYDSEMDDFIDDSDLNGGNISDIIRQITGYDKRRYQNSGSDDECMESSAYEQMREESRSLRIGIREDLEDMRLEQEEKKRKAQMMKKNRKK